jgi:hypothetical protein
MGISGVAEQLLASQERLISVEFVDLKFAF